MAIIDYRKNFIEKLSEFSKKIHFEISGEDFEIKYKPAFSTKEEF